MNSRPRRNDHCPCGSGLKYKYCCIKKDLKERKIQIPEKCDKCGNHLYLDMTQDILNIYASSQLPLKNFCKDHEMYFFGMITVGQAMELEKKLNDQTLTMADFFNAYTAVMSKEPTMKLLEAAFEEYEVFRKREPILKDAFEAHFDGKYTLSIPALFAQLEGILREIGNLKNSENVKPTIPTDIWDEKLMFIIKDDAQFFNVFIQKLFEGSGDPDKFNRNPILHGFKIDYHSYEHSLILILAILELRLFNWWKQKADYIKLTVKK